MIVHDGLAGAAQAWRRSAELSFGHHGFSALLTRRRGWLCSVGEIRYGENICFSLQSCASARAALGRHGSYVAVVGDWREGRKVKIAAFTGGVSVPSARFRVRQLIAPLSAEGVDLKEFHTYTNAYPPPSTWMRIGWGALRLAELSVAVAKSHTFDGALLQRSMITRYRTLEHLTRAPRFFDVDDAIHLFGDGRFVREITARCERVIVGNDWLAEVYRQWHKDVVVIPTAIDTKWFRVKSLPEPSSDLVNIGWMGTSANFPYLFNVIPSIEIILSKFKNVNFIVVSDRMPEIRLPSDRWSYRAWSLEREVDLTHEFDIGLMPLGEDEWSLGKCSFKMLQYMSCGIPVVVSPVGMNKKILEMGRVGLGAGTTSEWSEALESLILSAASRRDMGRVGRKLVEEVYSVDVIATKVAEAIKGVK